MTPFAEHPFFGLLGSLHLPPEDFAIAGSGPLFARGWIAEIGDLDVIARGQAWRRICQRGEVEEAPLASVHRVLLFDGKIEVLDGWFPAIWDVNTLIDEADLISGLRFVKLEVVAETKKMLQRPQDIQHLDRIAINLP
jgi:hypothetical protein